MQLSAAQEYAAGPRPGRSPLGGEAGPRRRPRRRGWPGRGSAMMARARVAAAVVFAKTRNDPRVKRPRACPMQPSVGMRPGGTGGWRKPLPPDQGSGGKAFPPCAGCDRGPRWRRRRGRRGFRKTRGDPMQLSASQAYATGFFTGWDRNPVVRGGPAAGVDQIRMSLGNDGLRRALARPADRRRAATDPRCSLGRRAGGDVKNSDPMPCNVRRRPWQGP